MTSNIRVKRREQCEGKSPQRPEREHCGRAVLAAATVDPKAQMIEKRGAYVRALHERWPELTASAALFVVQQLQG